MVKTYSTWKQLTGILVIRAKDGLNNPDGYTHSEAITLTKTSLFYLYFMAIFMLSHLFSSYFILTKLYFNPILPEKESSPSILFVFYFYFKPIFKQVRKE